MRTRYLACSGGHRGQRAPVSQSLSLSVAVGVVLTRDLLCRTSDTVRPERRETNVPSNIGMMGRLLQQRRRYVICLLAMLLHQCCNFMTTATAEVFRLADGIHLHMLLKYSTVLLRTQNMRHSFTFRHSFHWFTPSLKLTISSNSSHSGKNLWKW